MEIIAVYRDYIQLDQLLKKIDAISSGGETGAYLARHQVKLNGNPVHEKRKKIRPGDVLAIDGREYQMKAE